METTESMKGYSKLAKESTEKIGYGCRRMKGSLMFSDGSELREDDPEALAVVAYLKLITDTLAGLTGGEYSNYLKVMEDFRAERIDSKGVENRLKDVFRGHPELILELNRFLPDDSDVILSSESEEADQLTTKQQVSNGHVSVKQEKCGKKPQREKREQDKHGLMKKKITLKPTKRSLPNIELPSLITDIHEKERLSRQCDECKLVEDPVSDELKRKSLNPWTPEEKQLFLEKFMRQFRIIASFLENKTTADCVEYYYLNKKSGIFPKGV